MTTHFFAFHYLSKIQFSWFWVSEIILDLFTSASWILRTTVLFLVFLIFGWMNVSWLPSSWLILCLAPGRLSHTVSYICSRFVSVPLASSSQSMGCCFQSSHFIFAADHTETRATCVYVSALDSFSFETFITRANVFRCAIVLVGFVGTDTATAIDAASYRTLTAAGVAIASYICSHWFLRHCLQMHPYSSIHAIGYFMNATFSVTFLFTFVPIYTTE